MRTYWQAIKSLPGFKGAALEKLLGFGEAADSSNVIPIRSAACQT
jgi:hypothetical protein